jgi:hypothetical protein
VTTDLVRALGAGPDAEAVPGAAAAVARFLDIAAGATGRATFYNTLGEQLAAERAAHADLAALDRRAYAALIAGLPGATDRTRQIGVLHLLSTAGPGPDEGDAVRRAVAQLSVPRMLNLFGMLADAHVNNARARKLVLRSVLGAPALEQWCVRYRRKLAAALRHAWGTRMSAVLRTLLARAAAGEALDIREDRILAAHIDRYAADRDRAAVRECAAFLLGTPGPFTRPALRAYREARVDLDAGRKLPYETLEGLRGRFHPQIPASRVLELTKARLTAGQRLATQARAERAGVEVDVDFTRYDAVRLYLYAFRRGLDDEVAAALADRARHAARSLDLAGRRVALLLDGSGSMAGAGTQPLRPIALALALRDVFREGAAAVDEYWFGGIPDGGLVRPSGDTAPAEALVAALAGDADLVVVVGDGYENRSAGRFAETLAAARALGIRTPVVQLAPVVAAETGGVRALAPDLPAAVVQQVAGIELALCRLMLDIDPAAAAGTLERWSAGLELEEVSR